MKKMVSFILLLTILISCVPLSVHAQRDFSHESVLAQELKDLGLFRGVSDTDFGLESAPTREQAVTMLIRLLGKENEALNGTWKHPFTDVSSWADPYIGYAYENGLTLGISDTKFGTGNASAAMYLTFVLRALGYSDTAASDFTWNNPYALAETVGILLDSVDLQNFLRADVVTVSHAALQAFLKGTAQTLAGKLISAGVFTQYLFARTYNREQAVMASLDVFSSQIDALELPTEQALNRTISGAEMMALLDRMVAYAAPEKLDAWKTMYPLLRESTEPLIRYDMLAAQFLAQWHIGGDYGYISPILDRSRPEMIATEGGVESSWELFGEVPMFDIQDWGEDHYATAAQFCNISRACPVDGEYPLAFDAEEMSFHREDNASYADALLAILRAVCIVEIAPPPADTAYSYIITEELLAKANENPVVTSEDHPRWTGFVLGYGAPVGFSTSAREIKLLAEWGFNSARVMIHYETLFSRDGQTADLVQFAELDRLVAAAIENDVHLNILLSEIPGRNASPAVASTGWESWADLDLFINPEKQEQTLHIYRTLAARYKDIPNFNLSITPFFEALNYNRSTGLPAPEYTPDDVAAFLGRAIDAIREEDPDRLIIYEPTPNIGYEGIVYDSTSAKAVADSKGNVIISYNFCEGTYVYACMTMTEGKHIDNMNRSLDLQPYPNYIYSVATRIDSDHDLTLNGCLPAGTKIDFYLERAHAEGTLNITADGINLYSEYLTAQEYAVGERLSGLYPYAESDKCISITLEQAVDEIVVSRENGVEFCGIYLTLPDEYARERWYYAQEYDVAMGLEEKVGVAKRTSSGVMLAPNDYDNGWDITIYDDLTYTSEHVWSEASAETVEMYSSGIARFDGNCVIRFERGTFGGATWDALSAYYEDLLQSYEKYGFGWLSNDWWEITNKTDTIAGAEYIAFAGYEHFNMELLELLQKYQSKD